VNYPFNAKLLYPAALSSPIAYSRRQWWNAEIKLAALQLPDMDNE